MTIKKKVHSTSMTTLKQLIFVIFQISNDWKFQQIAMCNCGVATKKAPKSSGVNDDRVIRLKLENQTNKSCRLIKNIITKEKKKLSTTIRYIQNFNFYSACITISDQKLRELGFYYISFYFHKMRLSIAYIHFAFLYIPGQKTLGCKVNSMQLQNLVVICMSKN